jgi:hypothetical protein
MSEQNELVKPKGITQDEWDAATPEMRELLVTEAADKNPQPDARVEVVQPKPSADAVTPAVPQDPPPPRPAVAPQVEQHKQGRSAHEIANAAAKGQDVFPPEDGEKTIDEKVDRARVATAGP